MILFLVYLIGLSSFVASAAFISAPCGLAAFGLACLALCGWPRLRAFLLREF